MSTQVIYFADFKPGQTYATARRTLTEAEHVNFTTSTPYEKPIIPGSLTFSVAEGLTILSGLLHSGMAFLGVELDVLKPVFIGDTLSVDIEVVETRKTKKPDRGIVTFRHRVKNQAGLEVMVYTVKRMMRGKA